MHRTRRSFMKACAGAAAAAALAEKGFALPFELTQQQLAADILRPQYHLLPARNWMNDPNGPIFWNGQYHLFFQYNPNGAVWGDMHWAHAVSPDMVRWRHLPVALSPTAGGPDQSGVFSGSAVVDNGVPTVLYTGVAPSTPGEATLRDVNWRESQCLATSDDPQLLTWKKLPKPVIPGPPAGLTVTGFRDPCLWQGGATWYMAIGSGFFKQGGAVLLYRSSDLRNWEYLHPLCTGTWSGNDSKDPVDSGEMWECPDFFPLGGKHVLLYSTQRIVYWEVGEYDRNELTFHMQKRGLLDSGAYYAPKSFLDRDRNRVLWGWIPETRPEKEYFAAGWAGLMSLPRVLTVASTGELEMRIAPGAESLRGKTQTGTEGLSFENFSGELLATFTQPERGFSVVIGPQAKPYLDLRYEPHEVSLYASQRQIKLPGPLSGTATVHLYMDGSCIEIFVNDRYAHTARVYNLDKSQPLTQVRLSGASQDVKLWEIKPISPDRLTTY